MTDTDVGLIYAIRTIAVFIQTLENTMGIELLMQGLPMEPLCVGHFHGR